MREITSHIDPFGAADLKITCDDCDPNAGGASHNYTATLGDVVVAEVRFQHGPRGIDGALTGCTDSVLLAIVADRMECFDAGTFPHHTHARALEHIRDAMDILRSRAAERKGRGVLGVNKA